MAGLLDYCICIVLFEATAPSYRFVYSLPALRGTDYGDATTVAMKILLFKMVFGCEEIA